MWRRQRSWERICFSSHIITMLKNKNIAIFVSLLVIFCLVVNVMFTPRMASKYAKNEDARIEISASQDDFRFQSKATGLSGKKFHVTQELLDRLEIPPREFPVRPNKDLASDFVFVTYATSQYFSPLTDTAQAIQQLKSPKTLVVFDLGLTADQAESIQSWCMVEYRKFQFNKYPPHVADLATYAFKPMIWKEAFREFDAAFFIDATVHMNAESFAEILDDASESGGFVLLSGTGHSTFAATDPRVYSYFPADLNALREVEQLEADLFVINNQFTYRGILHWLYLCALDRDCIAPENSKRSCSFGKDRFLGYGQCHRYDQSLVNLLALDLYGEDRSSWRYPNTNERVFGVRRTTEVSVEDKIRKCV